MIRGDDYAAMFAAVKRRHHILRYSALLFVTLLLMMFFFGRWSAHSAVLALPTTDSGYSVCSGGVCQWGTGALPNPYIRQVPQPETAEERAAAAERERAWVERCHPVIVPDKFGVGRYQYSAAGCEFGR
jgi:hypothetical protein